MHNHETNFPCDFITAYTAIHYTVKHCQSILEHGYVFLSFDKSKTEKNPKVQLVQLYPQACHKKAVECFVKLFFYCFF